MDLNKNVRKICMVSSAVFGMSSIIYGWTGILGAGLGLVADLTDDAKMSQTEQFDIAVERAMKRTRESLTSDSNIKIIDELFSDVIVPDNLQTLIEQTETYRTRFCTKANTREIINNFELHFREEISKSDTLSNLYILSTGLVSLEKLKQISEVLQTDGKKLENIDNKITDVNNNITWLTSFVRQLTNLGKQFMYEIAYILVAMAVFLIFGALGFFAYDRSSLYIVPICYGISCFLSYFVKEKWSHSFYLSKSYSDSDEYINKKVHTIINYILSSFFIPLLITLACFGIIYLAIDTTAEDLYTGSVVGLLLGNLFSICLKEANRPKVNATAKQ